MPSSSQQKQSVITKIRAITKVVNEPSGNPLESFIDKAGSLGNLSALLSNIFGVNIIFNLIYMLS